VKIIVSEDDKTFEVSRLVINAWPGREDKPFMDLLDEAVMDTKDALRGLGHG
jgi:hypothetical protein